MGDPTAGGPVDGAGIPLARRDYPVTLPKIGDPVKAGKPERGGELQIYNYADYLNPEVIKAFGEQEFGVSVRVTTFKLARRGVHEALDRPLPVRRHLHRARPPAAAGRPAADPAAEPRADPEPARRRSGRSSRARSTTSGRATRCRTRSTRPGSAGATTSSATSTRTSSAGSRSGSPQPFRGRVGVLDDAREGIGMALMRRGVTDLNTEDPALLAARRGRPQGAQRDRAREGHDQRLRDAARRAACGSTRCGRATCSTRSSPTCPRARSGDVLSYWFQKAGGPVFNDCMCVGRRRGQARDGAPLHELHARPGERAGELRRLRRLPAADHEDRRAGAVRAGAAAARTCATASSRARTTPTATRTWR